ncbi:MAG: hypothetical protein ACTHXO_10820 [Actinomycetaceae bacterium]
MHHSLLWLAPRPLPPQHMASVVDPPGAGLRLHDGGGPHVPATVPATAPVHAPHALTDEHLSVALARAARANLAGAGTGPCQVLCLGTAAWVHVGGFRPPTDHTCRAPGTGGRARYKYVLLEHDVVTIEGVRVTSRARTVLDLLRLVDPVEALGPARCLLRLPGTRRDVDRLLVERSSLAGTVRARRMLRLLEEDLDRAAS